MTNNGTFMTIFICVDMWIHGLCSRFNFVYVIDCIYRLHVLVISSLCHSLEAHLQNILRDGYRRTLFEQPQLRGLPVFFIIVGYLRTYCSFFLELDLRLSVCGLTNCVDPLATFVTSMLPHSSRTYHLFQYV